MRRAGGVVLTGTGVILMLIGLLFLIAAAGEPRRLLVAFLGLALGGLSAGLGIRTFKGAEQLSPQQLRADILKLARECNGEVSREQLGARLGRRIDRGLAELEVMIGEGQARRSQENGSPYFIFPTLQPRLTARYCQYCDAEFPVSDDREDCPNCGGTLESRVAVRSLSDGEVFSMDESETSGD